MPANDNGRVLLNVSYLKHLRRKNGLTQDDLASDCRVKRLSVSISSIKRAESGQKVLYRTALNIAKYYNLSLADILETSSVDAPSFKCPSPIASDAVVLPRNEFDIDTGPEREIVHQYRITLLIECKADEKQPLPDYLRHLDLSFETEFPYVRIFVSRNHRDMDLFRYFQHLSLALTEKFRRNIRLSAQWLANHQAEPELGELRHAIGLTPWGGASVCPYIVSSCAGLPLAPATAALSESLKGWRHIEKSDRSACFVGRQWELSQLNACVHAIGTSQHGATVYLEGMEGIGKTALIRQFIDHARIESNQVIEVDLHHLAAARTAPLQYLVRQLLNLPTRADDTISRYRIGSSSVSVTLQVFTCLMAGVSLMDTERRLLNAMSAQRRGTAVREALAELVDFRLASGRLVLVIEDLYLADADFTETVKTLALLAQSKPFLLCLTTRKTGKYFSRPAWLEHARSMELAGLTASESLILSKARPSAGAGHREESLRRARGNPGYLLRMLYAGEQPDCFETTVNCVIDLRLNTLTTMDLFALNVAAVYGKPFSIQQWQSLANRLTDSPAPLSNPQSLVHAQLLKQVSDSYTFMHPITRKCILDRIPTAELEQVEKVVKGWVATEVSTGEIPDLFNDHHVNFDTWATEARKSALRLHHRRALELYPAATRAAPVDARADLLNQTAHCLFTQDRISDSIALHRHALDSARHASNSRYHIDLAQVYDLMGKHERVMEITQDVSEMLWNKSDRSRWDAFTEMHAIRGSCRLYSGCLKEARVDYQQALYCSTNTPSPRIKALALCGLAKCCYAQGKMQEAFEHYLACLNLCESSSLLSIESEARAMLTRIHYFRLDTAKAMQDGQQAVMLAHHTGNIRAELIARLSLVWVLLENNSYKLAKREIAAGLKLARKARAPRYIAFLLECKARLLWMTGAGAKAIASINRALRIIKSQALEASIGSWLCATRALIARQGEERYKALEQGEQWLGNPTAIHNALNFYKEAIHTAWQLGDAGLLKKYYSLLNDYHRSAPTKWAELHLNQARQMLNLMKESAKVPALKKFNEKARGYQMFRMQTHLPAR